MNEIKKNPLKNSGQIEKFHKNMNIKTIFI